MILSSENPRIKLVKKLKEKKFRDKENKFYVEGRHLVDEALKCSAAIYYILYSGDLPEELRSSIVEKNIANFEISGSVYKKISDVDNTEGIIAILSKLEYDIRQDFLDLPIKKAVICDNLQDPGNVGTIIRSGAASGIDAVFLSKDSADIYNQKVIRSSQGAIFHIAFFESHNTEALIKQLKKGGVNVIGADPGANKSYFDVNFKESFAVIIGNEGAGVRHNLLDFCDETVEIPMDKGIESLNAAVSASVILFEASRQRAKKL